MASTDEKIPSVFDHIRLARLTSGYYKDFDPTKYDYVLRTNEPVTNGYHTDEQEYEASIWYYLGKYTEKINGTQTTYNFEHDTLSEKLGALDEVVSKEHTQGRQQLYVCVNKNVEFKDIKEVKTSFMVFKEKSTLQRMFFDPEHDYVLSMPKSLGGGRRSKRGTSRRRQKRKRTRRR